MVKYAIRITESNADPLYAKGTSWREQLVYDSLGRPQLTRSVFDAWETPNIVSALTAWGEVVDALGYGFFGDVTIIEWDAPHI